MMKSIKKNINLKIFAKEKNNNQNNEDEIKFKKNSEGSNKKKSILKIILDSINSN